MIEPPRPRRGAAQVARPQLALELALTAYAVIGALLIVRGVLLVLRIGPRVWSGATMYRLTDPLLLPLTLVPGADRRLLGDATLADVTAIVALIFVPLWLAMRRRPT